MTNAPVTTFEAGPADHPALRLVGRPFPDGALRNVHGDATTIAATAAGRAAVVVFYRGAWCPFCNMALHEYQDSLVAPLDELGIALIAVSPQNPDGSLSIAEKQALTFDVLSDPGNTIATPLGLVAPQSEERTAARLERGVDLTQINADGTTDLVHPAVAVIDRSGVLRWIDVHEDYTTRTPSADILDAVRALDLGKK